MVIADFEMLRKHEDRLMCCSCDSSCELKAISSHYDASKFQRIDYYEDITCKATLDRYYC